MNDMAHDERHRDQDVATTAALRTIPEPLRSAVDDEFWRYLEQGEVRVQRCGACDTVRYPPEPVCPACLAEDATWRLLTGTGSLLAWTTFHRQYFPTLPVPYTVGAVATPEGVIVCGRLEVGAASPRLELPVRLMVEPVMREGGQRSANFSWLYDPERDPGHAPQGGNYVA